MPGSPGIGMDSFLRSISQQSGPILFGLCVVILILGATTAILLFRQRSYQSKWGELLKGSRGESLETLLYDHLRERMSLENHVGQLEERILALEAAMKTSKRYIGLVKYDAFDDVRGSQSFALALYDDLGDGAVVTGIVGRNDCRVFCKPLVKGITEKSLSQEELRAIREAKAEGPRSIVSN